jgi:DNA replication and repair protein RecF
MPLGTFRAERFRCLAAVELELDPGANLFIGPNASGKTSLLEAAFFLSRGRSFRSRRRESLIAHDQNDFLIVGQTAGPGGPMPLGIRATRTTTEWHVGGAVAAGIADLAEQFPAQVIDPEVHKLLEEGPGRRRRFLDWGVFHVEHAFLPTWRRYHQALRQRNAALKQDAGDDDLAAWERELATSGEALAAQREAFLARIAAPLEAIGQSLLDQPIALVHHARLGYGPTAAGSAGRGSPPRSPLSGHPAGAASRRHRRPGWRPNREGSRFPGAAETRCSGIDAGAARDPGTGKTRTLCPST